MKGNSIRKGTKLSKLKSLYTEGMLIPINFEYEMRPMKAGFRLVEEWLRLHDRVISKLMLSDYMKIHVATNGEDMDISFIHTASSSLLHEGSEQTLGSGSNETIITNANNNSDVMDGSSNSSNHGGVNSIDTSSSSSSSSSKRKLDSEEQQVGVDDGSSVCFDDLVALSASAAQLSLDFKLSRYDDDDDDSDDDGDGGDDHRDVDSCKHHCMLGLSDGIACTHDYNCNAFIYPSVD